MWAQIPACILVSVFVIGWSGFSTSTNPPFDAAVSQWYISFLQTLRGMGIVGRLVNELSPCVNVVSQQSPSKYGGENIIFIYAPKDSSLIKLFFSSMQLNNKLKKEAEARGEKFKIDKLRRNIEMDEYDLIHWRRSLEEREALIRDISCRKALGLPVEEPGRYDIGTEFSKGRYDPTNPLYRYDYWGEPKNSEKSRQERMTEEHNKSIIGKGHRWYEMSYEEAIKQKERREAQMKDMPKETEEKEEDDEDDDDDDLDFDYSILGSSISQSSDKPLVNGTELPSLSDEGMFEN